MTLSERLGAVAEKLHLLPSRLWIMECRLKGVECDPSVVFIGRPVISRTSGSRLVFSKGVRIASSVRSNPMGCFQPAVVRTMAPGAVLEIHPNAGLSGAVIIAGVSVVIGEGTIIGSGAVILDNDMHAPSGEWGWRTEYAQGARPVRIGRGVFIGARAIILKGVTIGDRARIGAGAVVTRDVPPGAIAAGNPARILSPDAAPRDNALQG